MKKIKLKAILISALCLLCLFAATGCDESYDPMKDGYNATVIYDFNGEIFDDLQSKTYRYKPNTPIIEPSKELNAVVLPAPSKKDYHISGWYVAETDTNGEPVKVDGKYNLSEKPWDFKTDLSGAENSLIYLVARWSKNYKFTIDVGEGARKAGAKDIVNTNYSEESGLSRPGMDPKWEGHVLYYYYYYQKDGKPVREGEGGEKTRLYNSTWEKVIICDETPEITVYIEWLEGDWVIVTSASQLDKYSVSSSKSYILDNDIDFQNGDFSGIQGFKGIFDGNGHTIKNFVHSENPSSGESFGLFSFTGSGTLKNITFENCEVKYGFSILPRSGKYSVAFLAANGGNASKFTNINFVGCKLNVNTSSQATMAEFDFGKGETFGVFGKIKAGTNIGYGDKGCEIAVFVDGKEQIKRDYMFTVDVGEGARKAGAKDIVNTNYTVESTLSRVGVDPKWKDHTLYYYYYYQKDGKPVLEGEGGEKTRLYDSTWKNVVICDETPEITVYVEWLEGDWVIVTSASQLDKYSVNSSKNYILDNDIDFQNGDFSGIQGFKGIFDGNGYTIKNFVHAEEPSSGESFGLFSFTDSGMLKNLTFENCGIKYEFSILPRSGKYSVAFLAANGGNASRFANINFVGCKLNVKTSSQATTAEFDFGSGETFGVFGKINTGTNIGYGDKGCEIAVFVDGEEQIKR